MTIFVAIVGLGILIFVHELGHFLVSLALGMRPRRFYIGFLRRSGRRRGTASSTDWARSRSGVREDLGMHRPSPVDVDAGLGRALADTPSLSGATSRLRGALAAGDHDAARDSLRVLQELVDESDLPPRTAAAARKGIEDLGDSLGPNAYWRAATWKRAAAIAAGPHGERRAGARPLHRPLHDLGRRGDHDRGARLRGPAARMGLQAGDQIVKIDGAVVEPEDISRLISGSEGRPLSVVVTRRGQEVSLQPTAARMDEGAYRLGFILAKGSVHEAAFESLDLSWRVTRDIGAALGRLVTGEGATRSQARSASSRAPRTRPSRARRASCSCSA